MPEILLQTKLFIPVTRKSLVPRSHLLAQLNAGLDGRLTLVSAPAGFGKTTVIVDWSQHLVETGVWRVAWFSLDDNDNNTDRFLEYFIATLQKIDGQLGHSALELLRSPQANNIQIVLTDLLNILSQITQAIVLVLDDYHLITNPAIHEGLNFLLENAPPHFHLVLLSRSDPPFSLARLRARDQLTEIRQAELRFSQSETDIFLNQLMALDLPDTAVAALEKRTEGWVAGLQMAAISMQGQTDVTEFVRDFTSSNRFILDYLAEEVLAQRPKGTRDFLLQTALLDRLCAPLCDAVLGIEETTDSPSQQILEQLENANLFFIPLDDVRYWYRYHHLFADLLKQQSRRENEGNESVVYSRASRWFEQAGYAEEAIQYALSAGDNDRALSLVTQYSENWLSRGEIGKILMWNKRLPDAWRLQNPQLILNHAWALLFRGREIEADALIDNLPPAFADTSTGLLILKGTLAAGHGQIAQATTLLEKAEAQLRLLEPNSSNQAMKGEAAITLALIYHVQGDGSRAKQKYKEAVTLFEEVGNLFGVMNAIRGWGKVLVDQAQPVEAETIFLNGLETEQQWANRSGNKDRKMVASAALHISLGQLYYQWNRLAEAEEQLVDAVKHVAASDSQADGLAALAKLRLAQNQDGAVPQILTQLEEIEQNATFPLVRQALARGLATTRCALYRQHPSLVLWGAIERSLAQVEAAANDPLTQARILVTLDRHQDAIPLLENLTAETERDKWHGLWLPAAILLCLAYQGVGEKKAALAWLHRAVQMAAAPGYIRTFLDEGEPLKQLLEELVQQDKSNDYATLLLSAFAAAAAQSAPSPVSSPLSPRELEVLQLIAGGLTNQEIANKLVIAPSTAKRHVINIYNKLNINNRAEATARAYELGLVNLD